MTVQLAYDIAPHSLGIHPAGIHAVSASQNMRWLFTGGDDGWIRKFDFYASMNGKSRLSSAQTQGVPDTLTKSAVLLGSFENESSPAAPIMSNGAAQEAPLPSPAPAGTKDSPTPRLSPVLSLDVHSEALWGVSGTTNGGINLFTIRHEQGTIHHTLRHHNDAVSVLKLLPGEQQLLSGSWDKSIVISDLNTGQPMSRMEAHKSHVTSAQVQPESEDANVFLSTSYDGDCLVWDRRVPETPIRFFSRSSSEGTSPPWCMQACWSVDGSRIYCGRRNECVDEWDFVQGKPTGRLLRLPNNSGPVTCVQAMPNGSHLLCASFDNIRLYDLDFEPASSHMPVPFLVVPGQHAAMVSSMYLSKDERFLVTASGNRGYAGYLHNQQTIFYEIQPVAKK